MPEPVDKQLYEQVKKSIDKIYSKSSAYKSGAIVKKYKEIFKKTYGDMSPYIDDNRPKNLQRWFDEKWIDIGQAAYPVYRPTKRINVNTPLTVREINKDNLVKQIAMKQKIKGKSNLPPFKPN